jgi:glycosyltransferase involved in cell wall biosynthesis
VRVAAFCGSDVFAGAERVLADLLARLDPGIDVTAIGPHAPVLERIAARRPGARMLRAGGIADKRDVGGMLRWIGALRATRPDILQLNLPMSWSHRHETLLALAMPGVRVVAVEHGPLAFDSERLRRLKRLLEPALAAHVGVGVRAARDIERYAGLRAGSVRAIPVGVEPFDPAPSERGEPRRVGTIARLHPGKRLEDLLRAVAQLPDVELEIVGEGTERERLVGLAADLGVAGRVRFAGWSEDTRAWLARWDAFALPSAHEGLPLVILDAMLARVPVVATPVGSVPEAIEHERTGLLVDVGDADGLAAALRRLLTEPQLAATLAGEARARALSRFTAERMARDYEALYAEILGASH